MNDRQRQERLWSGFRTRGITRVSGAALCLYVAFGALPALAGPPAGSSILNFATGAGALAGGGTLAPNSNTVRTIVSPLERLSLSGGTETLAAPGTIVSFPHRLVNLGNDTFSFQLDLTNLTNDGFDLLTLSLVHDVNGNGVFDVGDLPLSLGGSIALPAGGAVDLLARGSVPGFVPGNTLLGSPMALLELSVRGLAQGTTASAVDTVTTQGAPVAPILAFFTASDFAQLSHVSGLGQPLFVRAIAPACDARPAEADTIVLTLTSERGGDLESFLAYETGPSTGVFRILPPVLTSGSPGVGVPGDQVLAAPEGDRVTAVLTGCGAVRTEAQVWIEPAGHVFDGTTNSPVAGTRVELIDVTGAGNGGNPGGPARVFGPDGVTPVSNVVITAGGGRFTFTLVPASTYRLDVVPAAGHRFPSALPPSALPPDRVIHASGSYGGAFSLIDSLSPVRFDVPLDADAVSALFVEKSVARTFVEPGDALDYVVLIANRSDGTLDSVQVIDLLPPGFAFLSGTARRNGARLADPEFGPGTARTYQVGSLGPGDVLQLSYRARIGAGVDEGNLVNRAWAQSGNVTSNVASAGVQLRPGVFAEGAMILGTVYVDANRNRLHDAGDPGMPGVRLYLDDGTFAITDPDGRYSFYDLPPRTHALKVDPGTLPGQARLLALDPREEDTPGLRFVDLENGDMYRADFVVAGDSTVREQTHERLIAIAGGPNEAAMESPIRVASGAVAELGRAVVPGPMPFDALSERRDPRSLPAAAITTGEARLPLFPQESDVGANGAAAAGATAATPETNLPETPLEAILPELDDTPEFLDLAGVDTVLSEQLDVRVKGPIGEILLLRVNGTEVPASRVGRKLTSPDTGVEVWEYIGVALVPGENRLELEVAGTLVVATVVAPDRPARIELRAPTIVPADGYTTARIEIRLTDAEGVAASGRTIVTLEANRGRLVGEDLDPTTSSLETAIEGGSGSVTLVGQGLPGVVSISARALGITAETNVEFVPDARPLIAVASLEGAVGLAKLSGAGAGMGAVGGAPGAPGGPLFEAPFRRFATESHDGTSAAGLRGTMFLKGRVKHDILLTLGYDSDRPRDERRLRDIRPDAFYPLYGDASVRGYEAQSSRSLYARAERRGASVLYGDFVTPGGGGTRTLAAYSRSLNGVAGRYEDQRMRLNGYTSRDRARRQVDEIRGRGVSGPYTLSIAPMVENTERVEVIVRDRNQSSLVIKSSPRQRFTDYEVNPWTGDLLMRAPVPMLDVDGNPVYLRVSYEVETGGEPYWVTGFEARGRVREDMEIGGTWLDDHAPDATSEIRSAFVAMRTGVGSLAEFEFATTNAVERGRGSGGRVEWRHVANGIEARTYASVTDRTFFNPTSGYGAGRTEGGGRVTAVLTPRTRVLAEAIYTGEMEGKESRGGLLVAVDQKLSARLRGEFGSRLSGGLEAGGRELPFTATLRGRLTAQVPAPRDLSAYLELEQDTQEWDRHLAALGAEYQLTARGRLYGRHEFISSFTGPYALDANQRQHTTLVGFDANITPESRVFSEYRVNGALDTRDAEAAVGLRNVFRLPGGARLNATFERVQPFGAVDQAPAGTTAAYAGPGATTALTAAVDYAQSPLWKGSARAEYRTSRTSNAYLMTFAGAHRLDRMWSALGRNTLSIMDEANGRNSARNWLQVGFAYRPGTGWDALGRYELRIEKEHGGLLGAGFDHRAHVVSLHGAGPLDPRTNGSLSWAGKIALDQEGGISTTTGAQWVHGRVLWAVGRRYDAGVSGSYLEASGSRRGGLGAELGRRLAPGVWLSLGMNLLGYADDELTGEEYTRQGAYLRVRARFDESLFLGRPQADAGKAPDGQPKVDSGDPSEPPQADVGEDEVMP